MSLCTINRKGTSSCVTLSDHNVSFMNLGSSYLMEPGCINQSKLKPETTLDPVLFDVILIDAGFIVQEAGFTTGCYR